MFDPWVGKITWRRERLVANTALKDYKRISQWILTVLLFLGIQIEGLVLMRGVMPEASGSVLLLLLLLSHFSCGSVQASKRRPAFLLKSYSMLGI